MSAATTPGIFKAQNTVVARRLVAAQARMYSNAKIVFGVRILAVVMLAALTSILTVANPTARTNVGVGGGVLLLIVSLVVGSVEKRLRLMAAATQEEFDTRVFQLPWNAIHVDRPPEARIAKAADQYKGDRDRDWYDDTETMHRPYDVLTCQAANVGWGASMHRLWAWLLCAAAALVVAGVVLVIHLLHLAAADALTIVVAPWLAPARELVEQIRVNFDNARTKESLERKIGDLWAAGMAGQGDPDDGQLRTVQDKILTFRQTNAYIPDWLDRAFHQRNQRAMGASVRSRIDDARSHGYA